ncbi:hypothetical protein N7478_005071 [Penicillium angulare]|uniref:uncharacterized protein n=1 Tax=Penicillium angulare TaxID=116970 RepID=UPI00253FFF51|nr:uncharacterized protein N7478_005071 [Penicillium angulare]KAJ5279699.1 hypothetical protein N7478_005071 [Penicillium angulare]
MIRLLATISAVLTGSSVVYFYVFHQRLSSRIEHTSRQGKLASSKAKPMIIKSIPESTFTDQHFALHDCASKSVPRSSLPASISTEILFTKLVRRNMTIFTHFPQALMIRLISRTLEEKKSFKASHIATLDFHEGDLVCGLYRVVSRSSNKVEFEIKMKNMEFINGRLAIGFEEKGDEVVFCTETMMWRCADEKQAMPLEKPVLHWMHETAAWWLIDSGIRYLTEVES